MAFPLHSLLEDWQRHLQHWARTGELSRAALDALQLTRPSERLQTLVGRWSAGDFRDLPPVVVLPDKAMPAAAGAYALSTGTIYLNGLWLASASPRQALAVLTEELGHHLDGLLNGTDTAGDEGELFAALLCRGGLLKEKQRLASLLDNDHGSLQLAGRTLAVERAAPALPTISLAVAPALGVGEDGTDNLVFTLTRTGSTLAPLTVNVSLGGTASLGADYSLVGATGTSTNRTVTFAAGAITARLSVDPTADAAIEPDETVSLSLSAGSGYGVGTPGPVTATIKNDDTTLRLYDPRTPRLPSEQGWLSYSRGGSSSQSLRANGTRLDSTASVGDLSGYSNHTVLGALGNPAFPRVDRSVGFALDFRVQVLSETHLANNRAGFSVVVMDQGPTLRGIELGFWTNSLFSQAGGTSPFTTLAQQAAFNTTVPTTYSLRIHDQSYFLLANSQLLLWGSMQDYSRWPKDARLPYNPYATPNFIFFGDNTSRASAQVELGAIALGVPLTGSSGADTLVGTADPDSINGLSGADQINGGAGADWLCGGAGADSLHGGAGDDLLIGGSEADRFLFGSGASFLSNQLGIDTLIDFNPSEDRIWLTRSTFTALPAGPTLPATAFAVVSSDGAAAMSPAPLVYSSASGGLFYNPNGTAAAFASSPNDGGLFARLLGTATGTAPPTLSSAAIALA